ncbi:MAG: hypothetical protein EOP11_02975 [Proteobacteria bacterium]|nr:MAG: hypothetical protein EOP11_02975 [Pseudomonadota bacterium]
MKSLFLSLLLAFSAGPAHALIARPDAPVQLIPAVTAEQAEAALKRDMVLVARCDSGALAVFLGRYYRDAVDTMITMENGTALRYPVHGGRIERIGEKLSARFEIPESFRLSIDGSTGRLLYGNEARKSGQKNSQLRCQFYPAI